MFHQRFSGRLATLGLLAVLLVIPGLALWAAVATYQAGLATRHATELSTAFVQARYSVGAEESLERKYRLEPSPEVRAMHAAAAAEMVEALQWAAGLGTGDLSAVLAVHARYLVSIKHLFAAVDAGDAVAAGAIDSDEVDPTFDALSKTILDAAEASRADARAQLDAMAGIQGRVLIATPIVFTLGAGLVGFFWVVLRGYRRGAEQALRREAAAAHLREQRFRSLVQNASDVILICDGGGRVTYQSPAANAAWSYHEDRLLDEPLAGLVHPDARPALQELWDQLQSDGFGTGATRSIELQLQDGAGAWRHAQLILTNLLHEPSVAGVIATIRDIDERHAFERQLTERAFYDPLTSLPNRLLFQDRLQQALVRAHRRGTRPGLVFLDLDNFKLINDSLGHHVGDELLVQVAGRLQSCLRAEDTVARLGGDEFVIVLQDLTVEADALPIAETIVHQFARPFTLDGRDITITISMGIALGDLLGEPGTEAADRLLRNADVAMYRAKGSGRARYVAFEASMHTDTLKRLELEADLRHAIENDELRVYYQPIVHLAPGGFGEVEALVRWRHPTRGLMAPIEFISVAEETGLIVPLGQWVLEQACRQVAAWHVAFPSNPPLTLSVNLSPRQFQLPGLVDDIARTLRETGFPATCLKLEITEGVVMRDTDATIEKLWQIRKLGIKIAIDDFGTGYSSLSYLKRLPLDVLKIDRSFVSNLGQDQEDRAIVRAIISLAKSLDLAVTGEGIETPEQAAILGNMGCDLGQGYYYGRPVDGAATSRLLAAAEDQAAA